eukprot:398254-Rhodomonas_salina.1
MYSEQDVEISNKGSGPNSDVLPAVEHIEVKYSRLGADGKHVTQTVHGSSRGSPQPSHLANPVTQVMSPPPLHSTGHSQHVPTSQSHQQAVPLPQSHPQGAPSGPVNSPPLTPFQCNGVYGTPPQRVPALPGQSPANVNSPAKSSFTHVRQYTPPRPGHLYAQQAKITPKDDQAGSAVPGSEAHQAAQPSTSTSSSANNNLQAPNPSQTRSSLPRYQEQPPLEMSIKPGSDRVESGGSTRAATPDGFSEVKYGSVGSRPRRNSEVARIAALYVSADGRYPSPNNRPHSPIAAPTPTHPVRPVPQREVLSAHACAVG